MIAKVCRRFGQLAIVNGQLTMGNCFDLLFSKIKLAVSLISFGIECFYFFALMQKSNKKNQSAAADEILHVILKSRNSPVDCFSLKGQPAQTALIF